MLLPWVIAAFTVVQAPPASSPQALVEDVRAMSAAPDNDARFDVLAAILKAHGLTFTVEPFMLDQPIGRDPRTRGRNLVVTIGEGPGAILLGAHYDAVRLDDGSQGPGAVDNAASCVMLVRVAEALRADQPPVPVRIVWFDMEEYGLTGSARYVDAHRGDRIATMLNYDINAYGDTVLFAAPPGGEDARLARTWAATCVTESGDCLRFTRFPSSDDRSFGKAGIPTLSIAVVSAIEAHQMWLLLHGGTASGLAPGTIPAILRTIHTSEDVVAKVDGTTLLRMQRLTIAAVRAIAKSP